MLMSTTCIQQCFGPVTYRYGSGSPNPDHRTTDPDPLLSFSGLQDEKKSFLAYYLGTVGTFTSVFKDNMLLRSHKTVRIQGFSLLMLNDGWVRFWIREPQKLTDPTDSDPGH
jgi:hypothetical protein